MAGRFKLIPVGSQPVPSDALLVQGPICLCWQVDDYSPNADDYAWAAREIGDVGRRWLPYTEGCTTVQEEDARNAAIKQYEDEWQKAINNPWSIA